jgi:hypothetical protein
VPQTLNAHPHAVVSPVASAQRPLSQTSAVKAVASATLNQTTTLSTETNQPQARQMEVRQQQKLHLLLPPRHLPHLPRRVLSSSPVLAHQTQPVRRHAVDSNLENAQARLSHKSEMEDVGLETLSQMMLLRKHSPDGIWDEGARAICKIVMGLKAARLDGVEDSCNRGLLW